jgi:hypothetical protein
LIGYGFDGENLIFHVRHNNNNNNNNKMQDKTLVCGEARVTGRAKTPAKIKKNTKSSELSSISIER